MTHDDLLIRSHKTFVTSFGQNVGLLVGMAQCVQIGSADAAARDLETDLALSGLGIWNIRHAECRILTDHSSHDGSKLSSKGGRSLM